MNKKHLLFIVNPKAGTQKGEKHLLDVLEIFNHHDHLPTVLTTNKSGDATQFVIDYGKAFDLIVCMGGDGTLNEVIEGTMQANLALPLGYIPAGSTNDFANSLSLSSHIPTAAENIVCGTVHTYDIGSFNGRFFSYVASFGAFTKTSYATPQNFKNALGHIAYLLEGIKDIPSIHKIHLTLTFNDTHLSGDYLFGAVANSTSMGGILKLNPDDVDMNDGFFEIMLIKAPANPIELQNILYALATQKYTECSLIDFIHTPEATFTFDEEVPWSLDGEYAPGIQCATVKNIHSALRLLY